MLLCSGVAPGVACVCLSLLGSRRGGDVAWSCEARSHLSLVFGPSECILILVSESVLHIRSSMTVCI